MSIRDVLREAIENKKTGKTADGVDLYSCKFLWFWEDDYVLDNISREEYVKYNPDLEQLGELYSTRVAALGALMAELITEIRKTRDKKEKLRLQKIYDNLKLDDSKALIKGDTRNPNDKVDGMYL